MNDAGYQPSRRQPPVFPPEAGPRVWFITAGNCPIGTALAKELLDHGDTVVAGVYSLEADVENAHNAEFAALQLEVEEDEEYQARFKVIDFDFRLSGECQLAIAEILEAYKRIDVLLCCNSEALFGTVEELSQSIRTQSLVRDQFATNFFGPINVIKSALPHLREQKSGHIVLLTGITGHLGTPGLGMYCAAQWAIEGYCDSLAYEIAPFNIKMSIVQSNIEISVLTNKLVAVPPMAAYSKAQNPAPLSRTLFAGLLDRLNPSGTSSQPSADGRSENGDIEVEENGTKESLGKQLLSPKVSSFYPALPRSFQKNLIAETVHALLAIGGYPNPPARHIVGHEGVTSVKEKLKTVSEELEDFVEVSQSVDL